MRTLTVLVLTLIAFTIVGLVATPQTPAYAKAIVPVNDRRGAIETEYKFNHGQAVSVRVNSNGDWQQVTIVLKFPPKKLETGGQLHAMAWVFRTGPPYPDGVVFEMFPPEPGVPSLYGPWQDVTGGVVRLTLEKAEKEWRKKNDTIGTIAADAIKAICDATENAINNDVQMNILLNGVSFTPRE